jgi:xanthosine utilization system XapX-like protein
MTVNLSCMPTNAASKRYLHRFIPTMAAYVILLCAVVWAFKHYHLTGIIAYLLAVLPALPIIAMIGVIGLYLAEEKDEFQRELLTQSLIWAMGATLCVTTAWGFIENFTAAPHLPLYLVFPLFWFFVGTVSPIIRLRYR